MSCPRTARVADARWLDEVLGPYLGADPEFRRAAWTWSGILLLGFGTRRFTLTFDAGRLVAVRRGPGLRPAAFSLTAPDEVWEQVLTERRNLFLRHFHSGSVAVGGDLLEFLRLTEAVLGLVGALRGAEWEVDQ